MNGSKFALNNVDGWIHNNNFNTPAKFIRVGFSDLFILQNVWSQHAK